MNISSVSSFSSATSVQKKLSEETKRKLESMGIDTSSIKTEAQAQQLLKGVEKGVDVEKTDTQHAPKFSVDNSQKAELVSDIKQLAEKVGAVISQGDKIPDMLTKISEAINQLQVQGTESDKKIEGYRQEYERLSSMAASLKPPAPPQTQLMGSLDGLASYNKASFNLG